MGNGLKNLTFTSASVLALLAAAPVLAQPADLEEIIVIGSRFEPRVVTQSPTPIDSISADELTRGGAPDLQSMLKVAVPSFSTPRPVASGQQDFLTPPTMRGLSTGQLLVLINGKRRHVSALLNNDNIIGRGDVAYDFKAIPTAAISRIEVLRDGAAAQYGSDAIAGVMNIQLAGGTDGMVSTNFAITGEGDGEHVEVAAAKGIPLGDDGFVRLTVQYQDHQPTDRSLPDTRQQYFGRNASGALVAPSGNYGSGVGLTPSNGTLDPREATVDRDIWMFGDPKYDSLNLFLNAEKQIGRASCRERV